MSEEKQTEPKIKEKQAEIKKEVVSDDTLIGDLLEVGDIKIYSSNSNLQELTGYARALLSDRVISKYLNVSIPRKWMFKNLGV
jgi:hypothetical protein